MSRISTAIASYSTFTPPVMRPSFRTENALRLMQWRAWRVMPHHRGPVPVATIGRGSEGEREPPHITGNSDNVEIAHDEEYEGKVERQLQAEKEARWQAREARVVPNTHRDLLEFFLTTEEQEMEFEVARCRPRNRDLFYARLTKDFFAFLESELGSLRMAENETAVEDMMAELEVLEKVLREGIEAYDKLTADLPDAKERLLRIFCSRNKSKTLLEMAANNDIDRPLLALLDENINAAIKANEEQAAVFMEDIRVAVVKYIAL